MIITFTDIENCKTTAVLSHIIAILEPSRLTKIPATSALVVYSNNVMTKVSWETADKIRKALEEFHNGGADL